GELAPTPPGTGPHRWWNTPLRVEHPTRCKGGIERGTPIRPCKSGTERGNPLSDGPLRGQDAAPPPLPNTGGGETHWHPRLGSPLPALGEGLGVRASPERLNA